MTKLIGYARVSTRQQSTDRQEADLLAAGVRRDDLYVDPLPVSGHQFHLEHPADLVESNTVDDVIPLTSLHALEIVEAAYLSNRTRSQIGLPLTADLVDATAPAPSPTDWDPGRPYSGVGGGRNGRAL
ncbi:MAG TPA: hypothetical protein VFC03_07490 [Acidimicrobiales bacterium]|nr:hypothetical protein [Acidimicrobiales bacterium]